MQEVKVDAKISRSEADPFTLGCGSLLLSKNSSDPVRKSFDMAGMSFCLNNEIEPEDPFINSVDDI